MLTTPYSATFIVGDGETKTFSYLFEEVSPNFISVMVYNSLTGLISTPTYIVDTDQKQVIFGEDTPAPTADETVCIYRNTPNVQDVAFRTLHGYDAKTLENILSKIVAMIQEIKSNYFSTQVLQGDPWQLDLLSSEDDGATVNIDYTAKKLVKGLYFRITSGNLQVSADGTTYITLPKSDDVAEFRQYEQTLPDSTVIRKLQYRVGNVWFDAGANASTNWGTIGGNIDDQADLTNKFADKIDDFATAITSQNKGITQSEQIQLDSKINLAANSGSQLYDTGVWYAKMHSETVVPTGAEYNGRKYADFSQTDSGGNPIIVIYEGQSGAWAELTTITPPAEYNGYITVTSKIWDIAEQTGQQGGEVLWDYTHKTFTPYPKIVSFENAALTGVSIAPTPTDSSPTNQIVNKDYVDNAITNSGTGRNVGDIFYTMRNDNELNGAVECDGATYNTTDFTGAQSIGQLLGAGKVPYVSLSAYADEITAKGWCDKFGWDGVNTTAFKVPTLNAYIWQKLNTPVVGNGKTLGLTNGTQENIGIYEGDGGNYSYITGANNTSNVNVPIGTTRTTGSVSYTKLLGVSTDPTKSGLTTDTTGNISDQRVMVQLAISATDEALETCTGVLADWAKRGPKFATYGVTTYPELRNWIDNGAMVFVKYQGRYFTLAKDWAPNWQYISFTSVVLDASTNTQSVQEWCVKVAPNSTWSYQIMNTINLHQITSVQLPTAQNNYTWYRKYADGWVEQGGIIPVNTSSVTLPVEMADANYMFQVTGYKRSDTATMTWSYISSNTQTTTGFTIASSSGGGRCWEVKGMAA